MIRFLIFALIGGYLFYKIQKFFSKKSIKSTHLPSPNSPQGAELIEDPYCHTFVLPQDAFTTMIGGKTTRFCSRECAEKYITQHMN